MIVDPVTMSPDAEDFGRAGGDAQATRFPACRSRKNGKLVGILTNRDLRFETRTDIPIGRRDDEGKADHRAGGDDAEEAEKILHEHRVEKLLVVNDKYDLKGLITVKDIQKKLKYPNAAKDSQGRLRVGAAIGATGDFLERAAGDGEEQG